MSCQKQLTRLHTSLYTKDFGSLSFVSQNYTKRQCPSIEDEDDSTSLLVKT